MRLFVFLSLLVWSCLSLVAFAAVPDDFQIRLLVGDDTEAPTIPANLQAIPQSSSQIDIYWMASIDNVYVDGYRIYRDGIIIATTTLTNFSDIGLTPNTTYTYTVDAYDLSNNISSTSIGVATTTLNITPPANDPNQTTGTKIPLSVAPTVTITPTKYDATVAMDATEVFRYVIRWGRTPSYEIGSVSGGVLRKNQTSRITGLEPGTKYYIEITYTNRFGQALTTYQNSFVTEGYLGVVSPVNVTNVTGYVTVTGDAVLSWKNPAVPYERIRVVRNHLFYPANTTDGSPIYEGRGESLTDVGVFLKRSPYYYTIFVIAPDGSVSSGAVIRLASSTEITLEPSATGTGAVSSSTPIKNTVPVSAEAIVISYGDTLQSFDVATTLPIQTTVVISIDAKLLPPHIKLLLASIADPTDHTKLTTYQLKLSADGRRYETVVETPATVGEAPITIDIYDFNAEMLRSYKRTVLYTNDRIVTLPPELANRVTIFSLIGIAFLAVFFGWWLFLLFRHRRDNEDNQ